MVVENNIDNNKNKTSATSNSNTKGGHYVARLYMHFVPDLFDLIVVTAAPLYANDAVVSGPYCGVIIVTRLPLAY